MPDKAESRNRKEADIRRERQAAELRANLRKRKQQARGRSALESAAADAKDGDLG